MLWHKITEEPPNYESLFVDFGKDGWPSGIRLVQKTDFMFYEEDEGQWKGMGSEADKNAKRWCTVEDAMEYLATVKDGK